MRESASWTPSQVAAAVFFLAYLGLQLTVPTVKLFDPERPGRFGWQMFAGFPIPTQVSIEWGDSTTVVDQAKFVTNLRSDTRIEALLPGHLCRNMPEARAVLVEQENGELERFRCR